MSGITGDLNALYKVAYAKGVEDLIPKADTLSNLFEFVPGSLQNGKFYELPVVVSAEQGFTYSLDTQSAYDLNDAIGMSMQSAQVPGADLVLNSAIGYNQAARASHSATAFKTSLSTKFENMLKSSKKRLEIGFLYGNDCIASVAQQDVGTPTTSLTFVVDAASWATGMWAGSKNAVIVFSRASNNAAVDSLKGFKVTTVDVDTRSITVETAAQNGGSIANLETAIEAYATRVHYYGTVSGSTSTFAYSEQAGLKKQLTNTGTLFNISATDYDLWRGNAVVVSGQLTMAKVLSSVSKAVNRGLDEDAYVICNPLTWADLASNLAALRRFDGSYSSKKSENGSKVLEYTSLNGTLKIVAYNLVKQGDCFIVPMDKTYRVGAWDLNLTDPTRGEGEIFFQLPTNAGAGMRAYTNQTIFLEAPAHGVYISGITNSAA